jgi:RsmE family RNA methyltransferase
MADRFYLPGDWDDVVELGGTEAHHLMRVLRAQPGEAVELFNGRGRRGQGRVERLGKHEVTVRMDSATDESPPPKPSILLAAASPKGDRLRWMIEKVTELGVDRFVPLSMDRGVVDPSDHKLSKLEQTVIAACKQSGRNRLLRIERGCTLQEVLEKAQADQCRGTARISSQLFRRPCAWKRQPSRWLPGCADCVPATRSESVSQECCRRLDVTDLNPKNVAEEAPSNPCVTGGAVHAR